MSPPSLRINPKSRRGKLLLIDGPISSPLFSLFHLATALVQGLQRVLHRAVVVPILEGRRAGPPRPILGLVRRVPRVTTATAYLIGVGPRPEHAPAFAARPAREPRGRATG